MRKLKIYSLSSAFRIINVLTKFAQIDFDPVVMFYSVFQVEFCSLNSHFPGSFLPGLRKRRRLLVVGRFGSLSGSPGAGLRGSVGLVRGFGQRLVAVLLGAMLSRSGVAGRLLLVVVVAMLVLVLVLVVLMMLMMLVAISRMVILWMLLFRMGEVQTKLLLILQSHSLRPSGPEAANNNQDDQQHNDPCSSTDNNPDINPE